MLGYCLFPLVVRSSHAFRCCLATRSLAAPAQLASILCLAWSNKAYQGGLLGAGALWSLRCCVPFIAATVNERRRALAVRALHALRD